MTYKKTGTTIAACVYKVHLALYLKLYILFSKSIF